LLLLNKKPPPPENGDGGLGKHRKVQTEPDYPPLSYAGITRIRFMGLAILPLSLG